MVLVDGVRSEWAVGPVELELIMVTMIPLIETGWTQLVARLLILD